MNKEFTVKIDGQDVKLMILEITPEIRMESNEIYSEAFNKAIAANMPLRIEMEKILTTKGLYNKEANDNKVRDIRKQILDKELELRKGVLRGKRMTKEDGRSLAIEMRKLRQEMYMVGSDVAQLFTNTVESFADNERLKFFVYSTTRYADSGTRYWKSFDEYKADFKSEVFSKAQENFTSMLFGISVDELDNSHYENKWLRKMGFMNEKGQFIDAKGRLVDEDGIRLVDENGNYIDEQGNKVDYWGNKFDNDGNLLAEDTWGVTTNN